MSDHCAMPFLAGAARPPHPAADDFIHGLLGEGFLATTTLKASPATIRSGPGASRHDHPHDDPLTRKQPARNERAQAREPWSRHRWRQSLQQFLESGYKIHGVPPCSARMGSKVQSL